MKKPTMLMLSLLLIGVPLSAQQNNATPRPEQEEQNPNVEDADNPQGRFWEATVPGGNYVVAVERITSVSLHEYVLDAQLRVTEVVIDAGGRSLARFYHVAHIAEGAGSDTAQRVVERGRDLLDRAGQRATADAHNLPQKNYPGTSHAGTIEYRLLDRRNLLAIFNSVKSSWQSGRGRRITVQ